jgi:hypothetical protein
MRKLSSGSSSRQYDDRQRVMTITHMVLLLLAPFKIYSLTNEISD